MHRTPFQDEHTQPLGGTLIQGCCRIHEDDVHSSKFDAFFGSWRYFRWRSRASCVSNNWLLTGDLNFPLTLMPTFLRVPSPDFAASLISIFSPSGMLHCSSKNHGPNAVAEHDAWGR